MSDDGKVIDFMAAKAGKDAADEAGLDVITQRQRGKEWCAHKYVLVSDHSNEVECRTCKAPLDPHAVLLEFANKERQFRYSEKSAKDEFGRVTARLKEAKAEEKRVKARVANARKVLADLEAKVERCAPAELRAMLRVAMDKVEQ